MEQNSDSTDRRAGDFFVFGLGFVGLVMAAGGVILCSVPFAVIGALVLVLSVLRFRS